MSDESERSDPAAVFACAISLWVTCKTWADDDPKLNLSDAYSGMDQLMREIMRISEMFEEWACLHVEFEALSEVWPYLLHELFGDACLLFLFPTALAEFDESDCLRIALHLRLPVKVNEGLPVPIIVTAANPVADAPFPAFRIQTVRTLEEDGICEPFTLDDDPFDEQFSTPYFALYGVGSDGLLEHIADRRTYADAARLARNLIPGITFPDSSYVA